jgi:hypothetical protein
VLVVEAGVHDGPSHLVLMDENAKTIRRIEKSDGFMRPVWTPDGKGLSALRYSLGKSLARWNADGKGFRTVPIRSKESFEFVQMVAFSPDGIYAALLVDKFNKMLIARVSDDALDVEHAVPADFSYVAQAAWLDNSKLLFVGRRGGPQAQLWELAVLDGGDAEPRGIEGLWVRDFLALSPDRTAVVVCGAAVGAKETQWSLWKYSLNSLALTRLTHGIEDVTPTWRQ